MILFFMFILNESKWVYEYGTLISFILKTSGKKYNTSNVKYLDIKNDMKFQFIKFHGWIRWFPVLPGHRFFNIEFASKNPSNLENLFIAVCLVTINVIYKIINIGQNILRCKYGTILNIVISLELKY